MALGVVSGGATQSVTICYIDVFLAPQRPCLAGSFQKAYPILLKVAQLLDDRAGFVGFAIPRAGDFQEVTVGRMVWLFSPHCQPMPGSAAQRRTRRRCPQTRIIDPSRFIARFATSTSCCGLNVSMRRITLVGSTASTVPTIPCGKSRNRSKGSRFESSAAALSLTK